MKMFKFIAICDGFVHTLRQNTGNTSGFCSGVPKRVHCKYQRFGLQHAKNIANRGVLLKLLVKKIERVAVQMISKAWTATPCSKPLEKNSVLCFVNWLKGMLWRTAGKHRK